MARPSKLTMSQCATICTLRADSKVPVSKLATRFGVSESSLYKVLDGTYIARPDPIKAKKGSACGTRAPAPAPVPGSTPSIFHSDSLTTPALQVKRAALSEAPVDEVTLAAAELIVARAHYARALSHTSH